MKEVRELAWGTAAEVDKAIWEFSEKVEMVVKELPI